MMSSSSPTFKYTASNKALTNEQRQFYEENGYLLFRSLVNAEELDIYIQRFLDVCNKKVRSSGAFQTTNLSYLKGEPEGERSIYKFEDFFYDDVLFKYASNPKIIDIVSSIIGDNVSGISSMIINKPPEEVTKHPMHQDQFYFPFRPSDKMCAAWTAMEKTHLQNGCLYVIPGSHKGELYPHVYPDPVNKKTYHEVKGFENYEKVYLPMEKGDTAFFHSLLVHGSTPNITEGYRKAITIHYVNNECYVIDARGTIQQPVRDEMNKRYKKQGFTFENIWRAQGRLITGKPAKWQAVESKL